MTPVKTHQRYRCDYCTHRGTLRAMQKHEPMCWQNPNRVCPVCGNVGVVEDAPVWGISSVPIHNCPLCSRRGATPFTPHHERHP